jgi:amino acid adenylation domain-containing protein
MSQSDAPPPSLAFSPVQAGMLSQSLRHSGAGFYLQQFRVRFSRSLEPELMRRAWNFLLERHDSLRAYVSFADRGNPRHCTADSADIPFRFEDWSEAAATTQQRRLTKFLRDDRARGFAFDAAPLMRVALFRCAPTEFTMVWTSHHLLFDGRSRSILLRELAAAYQAHEAGHSPSLPTAPSFREFLSWMTPKDFSAAETYWKAALSDVAESTPVGTTVSPEPPIEGETRRVHAACFSSVLLRKLDRFADKHGLTANTLLQAAWAVVLSRYSNQTDVMFGAPRSGRNCPVPGIRSMVGVFVNTLPVHVRVEDEMPILDFLRAIRESWVAMRPFEQTPLREISRWCRLPGDAPLFDSLIGFENFQLAGHLASTEPWWAETSMNLEGWTNFALTIQAYRGTGIELRLTYDPARFSAAAIRRLSGHLRTTLEGFLSAKTKRVGDLRLLTRAEMRDVLERQSITPTSPRPADDVPSIFSRVARATPDRIALTLDDRSRSYGELDAASDAVAAFLHARKISRGDRVGVLTMQSFEQVEAILGILKVGAAYVPLDPEYPRERLRFMIGDAALRLVLGSAENRGVLDELEVGFETVSAALAEGQAAASSWTLPPADPDAAAYIMYTSGSTGGPKGVVVPHRGIVRLVLGVDYVKLGPGRTFLHMAPPTFDASTFELWGALLHGARCVLYPLRQIHIRELARQIETHRVDTLWLTAALFNFIIDEAPEILRPVRQLLIGGEALSPSHVAQALEKLPDTQLINGYGPTETTTFACCHPIPRDAFDASEPVPIGRPIGNTSAHVLDHAMRPVPVGIEGELFVGGAGVALGYLNQPGLTAERFVPDPFSEIAGAKLYRTGDRVCWREDGLLEFRGRSDDQVKIRGFRIEPAELARALQEHSAVKQAAVLAVEGSMGGKTIAAFYTTESGAEIPTADLEQTVSTRLPAYMIPASFTFVERMPLNANGKVDRAALLRIAPAMKRSVRVDLDPGSAREEKILQIFREVLKQPEAGPTDSFFELGGHSLLATLLLHRIERTLGFQPGFNVLFENPTACSLAAALYAPQSADQGPSLSALVARPRGGRQRANLYTKNEIRFLLSGQARNITRSFLLRGLLQVDLLERALQWVVDRHDALRTRLIDVGDGEFDREVVPAHVVLEIEVIAGSTREEQTAEVDRHVIAEAGRVFTVASFPFHRFTLLRLSEAEHVLVLNFHHIFFDGKSLAVFLRDMSAAYEALLRGDSPGLPEPAFQFNDVMLWIDDWLGQGALGTLDDYWKERVGNLVPSKLPIDLTPVREGGVAGEILHRHLGADLTRRAREAAKNFGTTYYGLTHGVANILIHSFGNDREVDVGIVCCMRRHPRAEEVVGNFGNFVLARTDIAGNPTFRELIGRTRRSSLEALGHRGLPFTRLRSLAPAVTTSNGNPFHFYLIEESSLEGTFKLPEIEIEPILRRTYMPSIMVIFQILSHPADTIIRCMARPEYFSPKRGEELLSHYERILRLAVDDPERRLSDFPVFAA